MSFNMDDYVDVAERLHLAFERYPTGSMQGEGEFVRDEQGSIIGFIYRASFYRTPDDARPSIGTAFEPIPGATSYTRNSEVQNAETSAWGRAIVACGFSTKKIASADEVRARQSAGDPHGAPSAPVAAVRAAAASPAENPAEKARLAAEAAAARAPQDDNGGPESVVITFGKHKGMPLGSVPGGYLEWLIANFEVKTPEQANIMAAARAMTGQTELVGAGTPDKDIPF